MPTPYSAGFVYQEAVNVRRDIHLFHYLHYEGFSWTKVTCLFKNTISQTISQALLIQMFRKCLGNVVEMSRKCQGDVNKMSRKCLGGLGNVKEMFGKSLGRLWEIRASDNFLIWKFGRTLGDRLGNAWEVFGKRLRNLSELTINNRSAEFE
jgi:hypothetical protein